LVIFKIWPLNFGGWFLPPKFPNPFLIDQNSWNGQGKRKGNLTFLKGVFGEPLPKRVGTPIMVNLLRGKKEVE